MSLKANRSCFGKNVMIFMTREFGVVAGFCQHRRCSQPEFYLEYEGADGTAKTGWFYRDQLEVQPDPQ